MTDPITIHVSTGSEGLEIVETLARRGLPAALVSQPSGWTVEIVTRDERRPVLLHEATVALESAACSLGARSLPIRVSGRGYDVRPHLDVVAPPLGPEERPPDAGAPRPARSPVDCRGYRVDAESGPIGVVAAMRRDAGTGRPTHLVVRAGPSGRRSLLIPADDVEVTIPAARQLLLRPDWRPALPAGAAARSRELPGAAGRQPRSRPTTLAPRPGRGPRLVNAPARSLDVRAARPFDRLDDGWSGAGTR